MLSWNYIAYSKYNILLEIAHTTAKSNRNNASYSGNPYLISLNVSIIISYLFHVMAAAK